MKINILKNEKNQIEVEIDNQTLAELLRVFLNKDPNVEFAAWRREHYTKLPILKVITSKKTAKKAFDDAVTSITKELDNFLKDFEKLK